jgi:diadenosine tetraphosphate (Ap4A) HIT family hydrolase
MSGHVCPFCYLPAERILGGNEHGWITRDACPVSPGHALVIPKRHLGSFFELSAVERDALLDLLTTARDQLDRELRPCSYNIGINDGPAAGQMVPHLHIHLIPRYEGDRPDPRGGVRWIFPERADYWSRGG